MIVLKGFIDLHTHTRYPDFDSFDYKQIEESAIIGGYTNLLAMPNSQLPIDCIDNFCIALFNSVYKMVIRWLRYLRSVPHESSIRATTSRNNEG